MKIFPCSPKDDMINYIKMINDFLLRKAVHNMIDTSKVNHLKKKEVEKAIQIAQRTGVVRRLIIFGSTVTDECREESDVDICLDVNCETSDKRLRRPMYDLNEACDFNCDILFYHKLGDKLKKEIDSKGVEVYVN